jgi:putative ATP-binding cassette transporter
MLVEALIKEARLSLWRLALFAVVAGLSDALIIVAINRAADAGARGAPQFHLLLFFAVSLGAYVFSQRYILTLTTYHIEHTIRKIRVRLADKIRRADLQPLERVGRSEIYGGINRDTLAISQAAAPIVIACQAALMILFCIAYIGYLSLWALFLTLIVIAIGVYIHFGRLQQLMTRLHTASAKENEFFEALTHLMDGFKEVKLSRARSNDLFQHLSEIAKAAAGLKFEASKGFADQYLFSQVSFHVLLAVIVFVIPLVSTSATARILAITAAIQFIAGPLTSLVSAIPVFSTAKVAVGNIERLEQSLEELKMPQADDRLRAVRQPARRRFNTIQLDRVEMQYTGPAGEALFTVGPLSLTLSRGETLFLVGGNGSGKTTLLKLLTGLYYPDSGTVLIDKRPVDEFGYPSYRELFSAIYSDYHLFDRLYGLAHVDERRVNQMLKLMDLQDKTRFVDGRFENQELSSGQKKRLALIVSILENKPICMFDEWAADQDPSFRRYFYEEFLASLKRRGKTIIAATHDDRYFHVADRVVKMEMGRVVWDSASHQGRGRLVGRDLF